MSEHNVSRTEEVLGLWNGGRGLHDSAWTARMVCAMAEALDEVRSMSTGALDALGFIDQTMYANQDTSTAIWSNAEVLELLGMVRDKLTRAGQPIGGRDE